jgi:hypothetical protein
LTAYTGRGKLPGLSQHGANVERGGIEFDAVAPMTGLGEDVKALAPPEYGGRVAVLTNAVLPQLGTLAEQEASAKVRAAASKAAAETRQRIEENSR